MNNILNINIEENAWIEEVTDVAALSQQVFDVVIKQLDPALLQDKQLVINVELNNDSTIKELNKEFRNQDKATNVLSFANIDDDEFFEQIENMTEVELGDIIIAFQTMKKESLELSISFQDHYIHILIHGILHLLGYDHIKEDEAQEMETLEITLLQHFNIENPYEEKE